MTPAQAHEIIRWRYPAPYEFYNTPESALDESLREIIDDNGMDYYAVIDDTGALFGMYEYSFPDGVMEIGLGVRPDMCGRGHGRTFVRECIAFGRNQYAYQRPIRLMVADFNARAIRLYRALGFVEIERVQRTSFGAPVTFIVMQRP